MINNPTIADNQTGDPHLAELLKRAYRHEIYCYLAFIKAVGIKPSWELKSVSEEYRKYFEEKWRLDIFRTPTPLVYQKDNFFICSEGLDALFLYREKKWKQICCTVLGELKGKYIFAKGKPFFLPPPKIEFLPTKR